LLINDNKYQDKSQVLFQKAPHPAIIEKKVFDKVQEILGENKKTFTSPSQNKYNLLLRGLIVGLL